MANSAREIKNRIKSIKSTRQITKAMELVAASKLKAVQNDFENAKTFFDTISDMGSITPKSVGGSVCHVVIAGDRGLAGGFNSAVMGAVKYREGDSIVAIGQKAKEYFSSGYKVLSNSYDKAEKLRIDDCFEISDMLCNTEFSEVRLYYTRFVNVLIGRVEEKVLLPLNTVLNRCDITEPNDEEFLRALLNLRVGGMIYGAVLSSRASEISARRNAMRKANDNADDMLFELGIAYNNARQAQITNELTEIVAGGM